MQVTFHGHACVAVRHGGQVVVVDPGAFGDAATALQDASTVLVTHEHGDHVDVPALQVALQHRGDLAVWVPDAALASLRSALPDHASRVHGVSPGDRIHLGGLEVVVGGGLHALLHPDVPRVANVTYLLLADGASVYHPGDSLDLPDPDVLGGRRLDVLLAPVGGPWLTVAGTIDLVRALDPLVVVPVHDAVLSAVGTGVVHRMLGEQRTGGTYSYRPLARGEGIDVAAGVLDRTVDAVTRTVLSEHPEFARVRLLEEDETVPPRPEEQAADDARPRPRQA